MNHRGISSFCVIIFFLLSIPNLYSQEAHILESCECAVVKFHLIDDCPCSQISLELVGESVEHDNIFGVSIDSVVLIHVANDFIDKEYLLNEIRFIVLPDTLKLRSDTSYIASIGVTLEMNFVLLVDLLEENLIYLEIANGRLGGFGDCHDVSEQSACLRNKNRVINSINKCNAKYKTEMNKRQNQRDGIIDKTDN